MQQERRHFTCALKPADDAVQIDLVIMLRLLLFVVHWCKCRFLEKGFALKKTFFPVWNTFLCELWIFLRLKCVLLSEVTYKNQNIYFLYVYF
jgi:hypothetical protein